MVNGELLVIRDWGFVIRDSEQRFFVAPFLRNVARPPTPPAESWTGYFLAGVWLSVLDSV